MEDMARNLSIYEFQVSPMTGRVSEIVQLSKI